MKKILFIAVLILSVGLIACGSDDSNKKWKPEPRFETVRVSDFDDSVFNNSALKVKSGVDRELPYVPISSLVSYDGNTHYYLYYMGYVRNVPVTTGNNYYFDGGIPITISYETTESIERTVSNSITHAREQTWEKSVDVTVGIEVEKGINFIAKAKVAASVSSSFTQSFGGSISTSNTVETAEAKGAGVNQAIAATIGERGEPAGIYRFVLRGTTDVFMLIKVDPHTRAVNSYEKIYTAREDSYAWGVDYSPDFYFRKTAPGDLFQIPDIDFTEVDPPTDIADAPLEPCPPSCNCNGEGNCGHFPCTCSPVEFNLTAEVYPYNTANVSGTGSRPGNRRVIVTAEPNNGQTFVKWVNVGAAGNITIHNPRSASTEVTLTGNATIRALVLPTVIHNEQRIWNGNHYVHEMRYFRVTNRRAELSRMHVDVLGNDGNWTVLNTTVSTMAIAQTRTLDPGSNIDVEVGTGSGSRMSDPGGVAAPNHFIRMRVQGRPSDVYIYCQEPGHDRATYYEHRSPMVWMRFISRTNSAEW